MATHIYKPNGPAHDLRKLLAAADAHFDTLPLLAEENQRFFVRRRLGLRLWRLKPTLYSITFNRSGVVEGTDNLRLRVSEILWNLLLTAV